MSKDNKKLSKAIEDLRREIRAKIRGVKESVKFCSDNHDNVKGLKDEVK